MRFGNNPEPGTHTEGCVYDFVICKHAVEYAMKQTQFRKKKGRKGREIRKQQRKEKHNVPLFLVFSSRHRCFLCSSGRKHALCIWSVKV